MPSSSKHIAVRSTHPPRFGAMVLAALLFQGLVPMGYMPASAAGGWLFELCPDGLTPGVTEVLHGDHADHGLSGARDHHGPTQHSGAEPAPIECPFAAFGFAALADEAADPLGVPIDLADAHAGSHVAAETYPASFTSYRTRAPPSTTFA